MIVSRPVTLILPKQFWIGVRDLMGGGLNRYLIIVFLCICSLLICGEESCDQLFVKNIQPFKNILWGVQ